MNTQSAAQTRNLKPFNGAYPEPDQVKVDALAESIKRFGILNPIHVFAVGDGYQIAPGGGVARWRAAQKLGIEIVPIYVVQLSSQELPAASQMANLEQQSVSPEERLFNLEGLFAVFGINGVETILEQLPDLRKDAEANPALRARINSLLSQCQIDIQL